MKVQTKNIGTLAVILIFSVMGYGTSSNDSSGSSSGKSRDEPEEVRVEPAERRTAPAIYEGPSVEDIVSSEEVLNTPARKLKAAYDKATDLQRDAWRSDYEGRWFHWTAPLEELNGLDWEGCDPGPCPELMLKLDLGVVGSMRGGHNPPYASIECYIPPGVDGIAELIDAKRRTKIGVLARLEEGDERSMDFVFVANPCFPVKVGKKAIASVKASPGEAPTSGKGCWKACVAKGRKACGMTDPGIRDYEEIKAEGACISAKSKKCTKKCGWGTSMDHFEDAAR